MSDPTFPPDPAGPPPGPPTELAAAPEVAPAAPAPVTPATNVRSWLVAGGVATVLAIGAGYVLGSSGDDTATADAATAAATADAGAAQTGAPGGGQVLSGGPGGGAFPGAGTSGTISSIDGDTLTVDADDGTSTTVQTDDDTVVRETAEGSVEDLAEGDNVVVMGEADDAGNVTASNVVDNGDAEVTLSGGPGDLAGATPPAPPDGQAPDGQSLPTPSDGADGGVDGPGGFGQPTAGAVTAVDGDTFTVETADGTEVTVTLTDDTTVSVARDLDVDDLEEGDTVRVTGETGDDDVVTASVIQVGDVAFGGPMGSPPDGAPSGAVPSGDVVTDATGTDI